MAKRRKTASKTFSLSYTEWVATALLAVAILSALAFILPGSPLVYWKDLLGAGFGLGAMLLPPLLIFLGLALIWHRFDREYTFCWPMATGWVILFFTGLAALQMATQEPPGPGTGGGWVGSALLGLFRQTLGQAGTAIILLVAGAIGSALALRLQGQQLAKLANLAVQSGWWSLQQVFHLGQRTASGAILPQRQRAVPQPEEPPFAAVAPAMRVRQPHLQPKTDARATQPAAPVQDGRWRLPDADLLEVPSESNLPSDIDLEHNSRIIRETLSDFGIIAHVVEIRPGPTVTQYGIDPGFREKRDRYGALLRRERVKVSDITSLKDDLALALATQSLRIEAPVPGRNVIGIEVPNTKGSMVSLRSVMDTEAYARRLAKSKLTIALGESVSGEAVVGDLASMPHLLIAGSTGSGKSVCINAILTCLLMQTTPDDLRLLMVDPKRVELTGYNDVPHLLRRVVVDVDRVVGVLGWLVQEMDRRLKEFEIKGCRNIGDYNRRAKQLNQPNMYYIVLVIDELADLMVLAADEVEKMLCRLAQLARATGIHLVVATQRPSVDVITGLIKANFPTRISFAMTTQIDSRTILDVSGAEKLLGRGDMLYMPTDVARPIRVQGCFVSDAEIERVVRFWKNQGMAQYVEELENAPAYTDTSAEAKVDEMYADAVALARQHRTISVSLLQRRLAIGYARAARLMDTLEADGIVGPSQGGRSREVLIPDEDVAEEEQTPA